jgi:hypothetical protein
MAACRVAQHGLDFTCRFCGQLYARGKNHQGFVKLPLPVGFRVGQRVRITLGAVVSVTVNPAD